MMSGMGSQALWEFAHHDMGDGSVMTKRVRRLCGMDDDCGSQTKNFFLRV